MSEAKTRPAAHVHLGVVAALAFGAFCLYLFTRGTDWAAVGASMRRAKPGWLLCSQAAIWASIVLRGFRWRVLLLQVRPIAVLRLYNMEMIGILGSGLLPARIGEVARSLLLARRERVPVLSVLASVLAERLLDLLMVGVLLVTSLRLFDFPLAEAVDLPWASQGMTVDSILRQAGTALAVLFAGLLAAIVVLLAVPRIDDLAGALLGRLSAGAAERGTRWLGSVRTGLGVFRRPGELAAAIAWTSLIWGAVAIANYCMFPAFGLEIGLLGTLLLTAGLAVSVALPQAPGSLGVFQLAVTLILVNCFAASEADAKAIAIVLWLIQLFTMLVLALPSLAVEGVGLGDIWRSRVELPADPPPEA